MKKLFTTCAALAVTSLIVFSCKKSSPAAVVAAPLTTGATTNPSGFFTIFNQCVGNAISGIASASSASTISPPIGLVSLGTVTLNNTDTLFSSSTSYYYMSASLPLITGNPTWKISGGSTVGAFTYTMTKTIPNLSAVNLNISSFSKSTNLILSKPNITADSITYTLVDGNGGYVTKTVTGSSPGYTFTPSMMNPLNLSNQTATIEITALNYEYSVQGGKNILFMSTSIYKKENVTINQ